MSSSKQFLADIEAFVARTNSNYTAFGKQALNDPNFVRDLQRGRKPTLGVVDKVYDFMRLKDDSQPTP